MFDACVIATQVVRGPTSASRSSMASPIRSTSTRQIRTPTPAWASRVHAPMLAS
jgi:hypothetical protein